MKRLLFIGCISFLFVFAVTFSGCKGCNNSEENLKIPKNLPVTTEQPSPKNEQVIDNIVNSFPSPVEISAIIKNLDIPFSKRYLADPGIIENYDTNNKKAFGLGVLSADLGYLNVYEETTLIVEYLSAIKRLADDLRVGQFIDFQSLKRLATSNDNMDSLIFLSLTSFTNINQFLQNNHRGNLSLLMVTGVWLESLYLMTQVYKYHPDKRLRDLIGDQKTLFTMLYKAIKLYNVGYFKVLGQEFDKLNSVFSKITITYEKVNVPKERADTNGIPVYEQQETSVVHITDAQVKQLINITQQVRNKLINL